MLWGVWWPSQLGALKTKKLNKQTKNKKKKAQCGVKTLQFVFPYCWNYHQIQLWILMALTFDSLKPNGLCKWETRTASFTLMACFIDIYLMVTQQMGSHQCSPQKKKCASQSCLWLNLINCASSTATITFGKCLEIWKEAAPTGGCIWNGLFVVRLINKAATWTCGWGW